MDFQEQIERERELLVESIKKVVAIDSTEQEPLPGMPFGEGPAKALQCTLQIGQQMGFQTENFDNYAGHIDFGDGEEILGILCHVDVVPCGEGWICDPFRPQVIDGKLYGRGVLDDKGPMMTCLHAMRILKEMNVPLKKKVRLIIGANEETDWKCMDYYFQQKKIAPPQIAFTPDAEFPLKFAEKGVLQYQLATSLSEEIICSGGNAVNSVPEYAMVVIPKSDLGNGPAHLQEKLRQWEEETRCKLTVTEEEAAIKLEARGQAAHAAWPEGGINAISAVMTVVREAVTSGELARIASFYMDAIGADLYGANIGAAAEDEVSGKLSFNVGKMEVKDGRFILSIDNRVPVTCSCSEVVQRVKEHLEDSGFTLEHPDIIESIYVEKDSFLVETLMDVYRESTGDIDAQPQVDGACTYARTMKNCVAFGALLPDQPNGMHGKNEFLEVAKLDMWLKIYLEAIYRLAK